MRALNVASLLASSVSAFAATPVLADAEALWERMQASGFSASEVSGSGSEISLAGVQIAILPMVNPDLVVRVPEMSLSGPGEIVEITIPETTSADVFDKALSEVYARVSLAHEDMVLTAEPQDQQPVNFRLNASRIDLDAEFLDDGTGETAGAMTLGIIQPEFSLQNGIQAGVAAGQNSYVNAGLSLQLVDQVGNIVTDLTTGGGEGRINYSSIVEPRLLGAMSGTISLSDDEISELVQSMLSQAVIDIETQTTDMEQQQPVLGANDVPFGSMTSVIETASSSVSMEDGDIALRTTANGFSAVVESNEGLRLPESFTFDFNEIGFGMNASTLGDQMTGRVIYALGGLSFGDSLWNFYDPEERLDRSPISFVLDAVVGVPSNEIWSGDAQSLSSVMLRLNKLDIQALGGEVVGNGEVLVRNMVPLGQALIGVNGFADVLDGLVAASAISGAESSQVKGLMSMFGQPNDEGGLNFAFDFEEDGSIKLNGAAIQ